MYQGHWAVLLPLFIMQTCKSLIYSLQTIIGWRDGVGYVVSRTISTIVFRCCSRVLLSVHVNYLLFLTYIGMLRMQHCSGCPNAPSHFISNNMLTRMFFRVLFFQVDSWVLNPSASIQAHISNLSLKPYHCSLSGYHKTKWFFFSLTCLVFWSMCLFTKRMKTQNKTTNSWVRAVVREANIYYSLPEWWNASS